MTRARQYDALGYRETTTGTALRLSEHTDLFVSEKGEDARKKLADEKERRGHG